MIPEVHLPSQGQTLRKNNWGYAYRITEEGPKGNGPNLCLDVIEWLNVENNLRYKPTTKDTFCNVYAYDYCCFTEVYIPRVWWLPSSISQIESGKNLEPIYNKTVGELSANSLYRWLDKWSENFGWERIYSLDEAQEAANIGESVVICARRHDESASGHISIVAPESNLKKSIKKDNKVIIPVQSQAGARLIKLDNGTAWWNGKEFAEYGFWRSTKTIKKSEPLPSHPETANPIKAESGKHIPLHLRK